jgi:hypothetical protein
MIDETGRKPFVTLTPDEENYIDFKRAKNEIILINTQNQVVLCT